MLDLRCVCVCLRAAGLLREQTGCEKAGADAGSCAGTAGLHSPSPLLLAQHIMEDEDHTHRSQAGLVAACQCPLVYRMTAFLNFKTFHSSSDESC